MSAGTSLLNNARVQLGRRLRQPDVDKALESAQARFRRTYPEWAASFFDEHFVAAHVRPLLTEHLKIDILPDPVELADEWSGQLWWRSNRARQKRVTELTPAAACFLLWVEGELVAG
jgi:hypothetical protein